MNYGPQIWNGPLIPRKPFPISLENPPLRLLQLQTQRKGITYKFRVFPLYRTQFAGCLRILTGRRRQPRMSTSRPTSEPRTHRVYLVIRLKDERESSRVMRVPNFWKQLGGRKLLGVLLRDDGVTQRIHLSRRWSFHFIFRWPRLGRVGWFGEDMTYQIIVTHHDGGVPVKQHRKLCNVVMDKLPVDEDSGLGWEWSCDKFMGFNAQWRINGACESADSSGFELSLIVWTRLRCATRAIER